MKLHVCYGTFGPGERHPCGNAYKALTAAGHEPEVVRTFGCFRTERMVEEGLLRPWRQAAMRQKRPWLGAIRGPSSGDSSTR